MMIRLGKREVSGNAPTYFIADISANHDGDLERAKLLIRLAKEAGADAAKFQNFRAPKIVSGRGFEQLGTQIGHQAKWRKSVIEVYEAASLPWEWTDTLHRTCEEAGIEFCSTPYDFEAVDMLDPHVAFYKIGSGDVTWTEMLEHVARKNKPVLLATGAASIGDVQRAMAAVRAINPATVLMQCNTNYTGSLENFRFIHLNVLRTFQVMYPDAVLGLSDHTPGHATVLGAVALGARVIEKHFTDDTRREGPDHPFSMDPTTWRDMVDRTRELELALGDAEKRVEDNERDTVVVQRRCIRAARNLGAGEVVGRGDLEVLRPAPADSIPPFELPSVTGRVVRRSVDAGEHLTWADLG